MCCESVLTSEPTLFLTGVQIQIWERFKRWVPVGSTKQLVGFEGDGLRWGQVGYFTACLSVRPKQDARLGSPVYILNLEAAR